MNALITIAVTQVFSGILDLQRAVIGVVVAELTDRRAARQEKRVHAFQAAREDRNDARLERRRTVRAWLSTADTLGKIAIALSKPKSVPASPPIPSAE